MTNLTQGIDGMSINNFFYFLLSQKQDFHPALGLMVFGLLCFVFFMIYRRQKMRAIAKQEALFEHITRSVEQMSGSYSEQQSKKIAIELDFHQATLRQIQAGVTDICNELSKGHALISTGVTENISALHKNDTEFQVKLFRYIRSDLAQIPTQIVDGINQHLSTLATSNETSHVESLQIIRSDIAQSQAQIAISMANIESCIQDGFQQINTSVQNFGQQTSHLLSAGDAKMDDAAKKISTALGVLSADIKEAVLKDKELNSFLALHIGSAADAYLLGLALSKTK